MPDMTVKRTFVCRPDGRPWEHVPHSRLFIGAPRSKAPKGFPRELIAPQRCVRPAIAVLIASMSGASLRLSGNPSDTEAPNKATGIPYFAGSKLEEESALSMLEELQMQDRCGEIGPDLRSPFPGT